MRSHEQYSCIIITPSGQCCRARRGKQGGGRARLLAVGRLPVVGHVKQLILKDAAERDDGLPAVRLHPLKDLPRAQPPTLRPHARRHKSMHHRQVPSWQQAMSNSACARKSRVRARARLEQPLILLVDEGLLGEVDEVHRRLGGDELQRVEQVGLLQVPLAKPGAAGARR